MGVAAVLGDEFIMLPVLLLMLATE